MIETIFLEIDEGVAALVDIREQDEWDLGHIEHAIHIPLSKIQKHGDALLPKDCKYKKFYLHCVSGRRAEFAVESLKFGKTLPDIEVIPISYGYEILSKMAAKET